MKFSKLPKTRRFGCRGIPMFKFILTLKGLRLTNELVNPRYPQSRRHCKSNPGSQHNVMAYEQFLNDACKVHFKWYTSRIQSKWNGGICPVQKKFDCSRTLTYQSIFQHFQMHLPFKFWRLFGGTGEIRC